MHINLFKWGWGAQRPWTLELKWLLGSLINLLFIHISHGPPSCGTDFHSNHFIRPHPVNDTTSQFFWLARQKLSKTVVPSCLPHSKLLDLCQGCWCGCLGDPRTTKFSGDVAAPGIPQKTTKVPYCLASTNARPDSSTQLFITLLPLKEHSGWWTACKLSGASGLSWGATAFEPSCPGDPLTHHQPLTSSC